MRIGPFTCEQLLWAAQLRFFYVLAFGCYAAFLVRPLWQTLTISAEKLRPAAPWVMQYCSDNLCLPAEIPGVTVPVVYGTYGDQLVSGQRVPACSWSFLDKNRKFIADAGFPPFDAEQGLIVPRNAVYIGQVCR